MSATYRALVLDPAVETFGAFRDAGESDGREYLPTWAGPKFVGSLLRQARAVGYVKPAGHRPAYAILDGLDAEGEIVQDFVIPHARAFRWWYRKLGLRWNRHEVDHA